MQCLFLFLASLVIPLVRDYTLHICRGYASFRCQVLEVAQETLCSSESELHPFPPQGSRLMADFVIYVQLPGNSTEETEIYLNNSCCCEKC